MMVEIARRVISIIFNSVLGQFLAHGIRLDSFLTLCTWLEVWKKHSVKILEL
jgi:hypothetical protein